MSSVKCHLSTIVAISMRQFNDICHNSMHWYMNIVSKSVYYGSHVSFLGVLSNFFCHNKVVSDTNTASGPPTAFMFTVIDDMGNEYTRSITVGEVDCLVTDAFGSEIASKLVASEVDRLKHKLRLVVDKCLVLAISKRDTRKLKVKFKACVPLKLPVGSMKVSSSARRRPKTARGEGELLCNMSFIDHRDDMYAPI